MDRGYWGRSDSCFFVTAVPRRRGLPSRSLPFISLRGIFSRIRGLSMLSAQSTRRFRSLVSTVSGNARLFIRLLVTSLSLFALLLPSSTLSPLPQDCAVCLHGYAPGYHHTCKSCIGGSKRRAVAGITVVLCIAALALSFAVANLVSVVKPTPIRTLQSADDSAASRLEASDTEEGAMETPGEGNPKTRLSNRVKETLGVWQHRVVKRFPLTVVKIIVVVWQIVTQVHRTGVV